MKRRLRDQWWYIERPVPLPLIVAALVALIVIGLTIWLCVAR